MAVIKLYSHGTCKCQHCGGDVAELHHKYPGTAVWEDREFGARATVRARQHQLEMYTVIPDYITPLCKTCHKKEHKKLKEAVMKHTIDLKRFSTGSKVLVVGTQKEECSEWLLEEAKILANSKPVLFVTPNIQDAHVSNMALVTLDGAYDYIQSHKTQLKDTILVLDGWGYCSDAEFFNDKYYMVIVKMWVDKTDPGTTYGLELTIPEESPAFSETCDAVIKHVKTELYGHVVAIEYKKK